MRSNVKTRSRSSLVGCPSLPKRGVSSSFGSSRWVFCGLSALLSLCLSGCATIPAGTPPVSNPVFVRANNPEDAWERTVDVVHDYLFEIERENRLGGVIETRYKTGAGALEPWHRDSVGTHNRLESTLQSIRRKAFISVTPVDGGFLVGIEAHKELEDVARAANLQGAATFLDDNMMQQRDLNPVVGQATPSAWIPKGRDEALEQSMLRSLSAAFGGP